jgi:hypothetical protein
MDEDLMPEPDADLAVRTLRFLDQDGASVLRVHRPRYDADRLGRRSAAA